MFLSMNNATVYKVLLAFILSHNLLSQSYHVRIQIVILGLKARILFNIFLNIYLYIYILLLLVHVCLSLSKINYHLCPKENAIKSRGNGFFSKMKWDNGFVPNSLLSDNVCIRQIVVKSFLFFFFLKFLVFFFSWVCICIFKCGDKRFCVCVFQTGVGGRDQ